MEDIDVNSGKSSSNQSLSSDNYYISDTIKVILLPERKGTFIKHTEYEIKSEKLSSNVERRYNDFLLLYNFMTTKYVNRIIPRLPPKQLMLDCFLEERRQGLQRWLRLVSHHPIISEDEMFKIFLTESSDNHQNLLQEAYNEDPEEFLHHSMKIKNDQFNLELLVNNRNIIRKMLNYVVKLKVLIEQQTKREMTQVNEFSEMAKTVRSIMRETNDTNFENFCNKFDEISEESEKYSRDQQGAVLERLNMIIEVLTAHSDMCERVEKTINDQTVAPKSLNLRNVMVGKSVFEPTNSNQQSDIKKRKAFGVHCVVEETKFALNFNMRILLIIFVTIFTAGVINALMANDTETTTESVSEENSTLSENLREISANDTKEIKTLTYLLNGYHSILLRYEQEPLTKILPDNWRYNPQASDSGRPDPFKPKYTSEEALAQSLIQRKKSTKYCRLILALFESKQNKRNRFKMPIIIKSSGFGKIQEFMMIELQGDLQSRHAGVVDCSEKFVGDVIYNKYGHPILIIGHHILFGKEVQLNKPFAVIEKKSIEKKNIENDVGEPNPSSSLLGESLILDSTINIENRTKVETEYHVVALIKKKLVFNQRPRPIISTKDSMNS
ncbi:CLUMA_CG010628, isoform A [Clunio marinus]|uniref:CLUMA_CG010628, isoform A n=1 Tax=Clunio marinus TaxID=568069 RepID=A0A1J1IAE7_9DIPT|nr:CLUMA_CG010628, isoform A [Clunio marinus]